MEIDKHEMNRSKKFKGKPLDILREAAMYISTWDLSECDLYTMKIEIRKIKESEKQC